MDGALPAIPLTSLVLAFAPSIVLIVIMHLWTLKATTAVYANGRMLVQLLAIGYVLNYIFDTERPMVIVGVVLVMIGVSAWIALRPLKRRGARRYLITLAAIGAAGLAMLVLVTQATLDLPRWFEPRYVVSLGGMIFANAMNTVSLAAERFEAEQSRGVAYVNARQVALDAALIPQINALLAVGLVSLPGMMSGQILSGVDPLVAARYQIMVMCMIFGSAGMAAVIYLVLSRFDSSDRSL
jgi:putative ABC transport system permease protein